MQLFYSRLKEQDSTVNAEAFSNNHAVVSEEELVRRLYERDPEAFTLLYNNYSKVILGYVKRFVCEEEIGKEICQDVFIKVWMNFSQYDPSKGRLFTWMMRIARNLCLDHLKSVDWKFTQKLLPLEANCRTIKADCVNIEMICLKDLLSGLIPVQSEVVDMLYFKGFTQSEVAKIKSIPVGTVKSRSRAALRNLRKKFNSVGA